jgi:replicative DNA helicase
MTTMPQAVANTMKELAKVRTKILLGHSTGLRDLDKITGGLQPGQLFIVAARPGVGKSAFALQIARHVAESTGLLVPFLSYEMSANELTMRMLAGALSYDLHRLRQGELMAGMERDLAVAGERLAGLQILIDDNPPVTIGGVRSLMRRLARRGEIGAIFIDYLQLMEGDGRSRDPNRVQEIAQISRGLKRLATELQVPVVALSQLNRGLENRPNKRPMLSDLRESGSLEQDASIVAFLYRDHLYNPAADPGLAECIIAKQRNGPSGTVMLGYTPACAKFETTDRTDPGPSGFVQGRSGVPFTAMREPF